MCWADIEVPNRTAAMDARVRSACYPRGTFCLLSDGLSIQNHRITSACFRICSTHLSRSQAPFYACALRTIANRAEGTFALLRYFLGGDRPSQTARLALSPGRMKRLGVRILSTQGWYFKDGSTRPSGRASTPPTYPTQACSKPNTKVQ
jgi:hypothetical protein